MVKDMNKITILLSIFISIVFLAVTVFGTISPYVSSTPPLGQYHPLNEIWINDTNIDWLGVNFLNLSLITANNITTNYLYVNNEVGNNLAVNGNIYPTVNNTYSLGISSSIWANIYVTQVCLNPTCTAVVYWNGSALIIEAPQVYIISG